MNHKILRCACIGACVMAMLLFSSAPSNGLSENDIAKRDKLRDAVSGGVLTLYDIPIDAYIEFEMWDELTQILRSNHNNRIRVELPGLYYSRPYLVEDRLWVFENSTMSEGGIYVFAPDTLRMETKIQNREFQEYEGGVRNITSGMVISGGSDKDVDAVAIWNTRSDSLQTIKIQGGHYVSSIEVNDQLLFIGSCGGVINVWDIKTLDYLGSCSTSEKENTNWTIFNEKECINGIYIRSGRIYGSGEKSIFIWDARTYRLLRVYKKKLNDAAVFFYQNFLVEFKKDQFVIRLLYNGDEVTTVKTEQYIEDLFVTAEKILPGYDRDAIILSFRNNTGMAVYDFQRFKRLRTWAGHAARLNAFNGKIYATDERNLYQYSLAGRKEKAYQSFVADISVNPELLDDARFNQLIRCTKDYPDFLNASNLVDVYFRTKKLDLTWSFKYGKIGERFIPTSDETNMDENNSSGYMEKVYGYKTLYHITNDSDVWYLVKLSASWSGAYGITSMYEKPVYSDFRPHSFFLPPGAGFRGQFEVGEKEPLHMSIFPEAIQTVTNQYYKDFKTALSPENKSVSLIKKYLKDGRVSDWHSRLEQRIKEIRGGKKNWWQRLFGK